MKFFTLLLEDETIGIVGVREYLNDFPIPGDTVRVGLYDSNGIPVTKVGVIAEILDVKEEWETALAVPVL